MKTKRFLSGQDLFSLLKLLAEGKTAGEDLANQFDVHLTTVYQMRRFLDGREAVSGGYRRRFGKEGMQFIRQFQDGKKSPQLPSVSSQDLREVANRLFQVAVDLESLARKM